MKRWLACALVFLSALVLFALGIFSGVFLDRQVLARFVPLANMPEDAESEFRLMAEAWNVIQENFVRSASTEPRQITHGALQGMVDALGDEGHSRFLSPDELRAHVNAVRGELEGIGVEVRVQDGRVVIVTPIDGSPAEQAGLRPGDVIVAVDGEQVSGMDIEEVVARVKGPAGTTVRLTILGGDMAETREVSITRARIALQSLTWQPIAGTDVALVRLASFSAGVSDELATALTAVQEQGLQAVILDLRNNSGGLLSEAVGTASQFLADGNVLLVRDASGETRPVSVKPGGAAPEIPLAVLINQGTASAAEIVAGALQDAGRATVVGETSFGTGTVLLQFPLSDGSAVLVATEEWLTPAGRVIWKRGLEPDVAVALPGDALPLVPDGREPITPGELRSSGDEQLHAALELLTDLVVRADAPAPDEEAASGLEEDADPDPRAPEARGPAGPEPVLDGPRAAPLAAGDAGSSPAGSSPAGEVRLRDPACGPGQPCPLEETAVSDAPGAGPPDPAPEAGAAAGVGLVHVLLIGGDDENTADMNTDSLIVAVLDGQQDRISLLSIPRDLWVEIPGHGWGRINTAHRLGTRYGYPDGGGPGLLARTIQENLGIPIDHWVRVNYAGFAAAIDVLDGVEVVVPCPVNLQYLPPTGEGETEMMLQPGIYHMDGETALRYVRTRRNESDFERTQRQQQFLRAAWEQFKGPGFFRRLPGLWSALRGTFDTDLNLGDVLRLAPLALDLRHQDLRSLSIGRGQVRDWTTPGGASVLLPIPEKVAEVVAALYAPPVPADPAAPAGSPVRVLVRDGTGKPDLAGLLAAELRWRGWEVLESSAGEGVREHSQLLVHRDRPVAVDLLSRVLGLGPEDVVSLPDDGQDADLEILLGGDYNTCR